MSERLHRMVGGEKVYLTDEEEAAVRTEWAANDAAMARVAQAQAMAEKRAAALRAIEEQRLAEAFLDPNAPQEVKDYAAVMESGSR